MRIKSMKNILSIEVKKAFSGTAFKITLAIASAIVLWHLVYLYGFMQQLYLEAVPDRFTGQYNLFCWWLPLDCLSPQYVIFFYLFPLIACMPYAWSCIAERETTYDMQPIVRIGAKKYLFSKLIACFLAGGVVIALPLALDLFGAALFSPATLPTVNFSMPGIPKGGFQSRLLYSNPWVFCIEFLMMDFLWAGAIASLSFCFAVSSKKKLMGIIMPVLSVYIWDFIAPVLSMLFYDKAGDYLEFSVLQLLHACPLRLNPAWLQFVIIGLLLMMAITATARMSARKDIL